MLLNATLSALLNVLILVGPRSLVQLGGNHDTPCQRIVVQASRLLPGAGGTPAPQPEGARRAPIDGKVWIQRDGTEDGVALELEEAGIPKTDIVLAWHPPKLRPYTDYAAA